MSSSSPFDFLKENLAAQIAVGFLVVLVSIFVINYFLSSSRSGSGSSSSPLGGSSSSSVPRTALVLVGPQQSGKTTLFQRLVAPSRVATKPTHTSMIANTATVKPADVVNQHSSRSEGRDEQEIVDDVAVKRRMRLMSKAKAAFDVVDVPGHLRLYDVMLQSLRAAKVICIVVDGTRVQDQEHGAGSVASLLVTALTAREANGASHIVVACNKRDEVTSYSSKALQKLTEKELKQRLSQKGTAGASVGSTGAAGEGVKKSEQLTLDEDGNFDWNLCPKPVTFCDISAKAPFGKFSLDAILEPMI